MQNNVNLLVTLKAKEDKLSEFKEILAKLCSESQKEPGCIEYCSGEVIDENTFFIKECWENEEALEQHKQTSHFLELGPLLGECTTSIELKRVQWNQ
ncbi:MULTISPECIES: putative quinol monooxygenase [unclassified Vibrio]|uniref:Quinol monooxygenase n=1 Tax=Vibrio sp. HB236076 TaxID=3232307 RepID=A0AB39HJY9_9VIBR|nr:putative quinol monooxygenase [Vibrio sp. HB161653]MDP5253020.1 putative quinol monooxygenase [Vibrio sp. HB161653]